MKDLLFGAPTLTTVTGLVGRIGLFVIFLVWSLRFISQPMGEEVADSIMHLINLPFHESGHVIFSPFGQFMTSLGGSLAQVLVPAICAIALLVQTRDPFGASVCVWWLGESFLDLAPYINDARALRLVLLGGRTGAEVEGHDWEAVLGTLGWLHHDHTLARGAHGLGTALMIGALAWGALVLMRQAQHLRT